MWWALLIVAAVAIVVSAVVVVVDLTRPGSDPAETPASQPTPAATDDDGAPVGPAALSDVLPDAERIDALVGVSGLIESSTLTQPSIGTTTHPQCGGIFAPGTATAYADSPMTAVAIQSFRLPTYEYADAVVQAAVQFPDAAAAGAFVAREQQRWTACERTWVNDAPHPPGFFAGSITERDGVVLAGPTPRDGNYEWTCQRGLTAADDVVVDVKVCNFGGSDKAGVLATHIADRVRTR